MKNRPELVLDVLVDDLDVPDHIDLTDILLDAYENAGGGNRGVASVASDLIFESDTDTASRLFDDIADRDPDVGAVARVLDLGTHLLVSYSTGDIARWLLETFGPHGDDVIDDEELLRTLAYVVHDSPHHADTRHVEQAADVMWTTWSALHPADRERHPLAEVADEFGIGPVAEVAAANLRGLALETVWNFAYGKHLRDRSAGRKCDVCGYNTDHHTERHDQFADVVTLKGVDFDPSEARTDDFEQAAHWFIVEARALLPRGKRDMSAAELFDLRSGDLNITDHLADDRDLVIDALRLAYVINDPMARDRWEDHIAGFELVHSAEVDEVVHTMTMRLLDDGDSGDGDMSTLISDLAHEVASDPELNGVASFNLNFHRDFGEGPLRVIADLRETVFGYSPGDEAFDDLDELLSDAVVAMDAFNRIERHAEPLANDGDSVHVPVPRSDADDSSTVPTPVSDITEGMLVDLAGDRYADPNGDGTDPNDPDHFYAFEFEYAQVEEVEEETAECTVLHTTQGSFGFPPDHLVPVVTDDEPDDTADAVEGRIHEVFGTDTALPFRASTKMELRRVERVTVDVEVPATWVGLLAFGRSDDDGRDLLGRPVRTATTTLRDQDGNHIDLNGDPVNSDVADPQAFYDDHRTVSTTTDDGLTVMVDLHSGHDYFATFEVVDTDGNILMDAGDDLVHSLSDLPPLQLDDVVVDLRVHLVWPSENTRQVAIDTVKRVYGVSKRQAATAVDHLDTSVLPPGPDDIPTFPSKPTDLPHPDLDAVIGGLALGHLSREPLPVLIDQLYGGHVIARTLWSTDVLVVLDGRSVVIDQRDWSTVTVGETETVETGLPTNGGPNPRSAAKKVLRAVAAW